LRYRNRLLERSTRTGFLTALGFLAASGAFAQGSPTVTLSPVSLTFSSTALFQKSAAQTVTLTNTGSTALSISGIAISGGNYKEFTQTNTCGTSVAAGANCSISVIFAPLLYGTRSSSLVVTDSAANSPQSVPLSGMGMGPAVTLSATTLTFGPQLATTTSAAQMVTLTNSGDAPLTFASITLVGTYAETNTCPTGSATLAAGSSCTFSITFAPLAGSNAPVPGLLEIMDNASLVPQAISLSGTAQAFTLSASPTTGSVSPGGSASYTISVTPLGGFNAAVSLSCGTLPTGAACSFSPGSVTPNGSTAITSTLTISTTGSGSAPGRDTRPAPPSVPGLPQTLWLAVALAMLGAGLAAAQARKHARRQRGSALALSVFVLGLLFTAMTAPGCGGGSSSSSSSSTPTPAGSYTVLITGSTPAASSSYTSPVSVTLTVQ